MGALAGICEAVHGLVTAACGAQAPLDNEYAERPAGQLPGLAAAHPEAYTALFDCWLRVPVLPADCMLVASQLLSYAVTAVLGSAAALSNTAAVAGLASALTSLVKRAVQFTRAAAALQAQSAAAGDAAAFFPAAIDHITGDCFRMMACAICDASTSSHVFAAPAAGSASGSNSQAAASAALLAVVLARSLVQLADAMEAAGPEVYSRSLLGEPSFRVRWIRAVDAAGGMFATAELHPCGSEQQQTVETQWQVWQLSVLQAVQHLLAALGAVGMAPPAAAAGASAAAAGASAAAAAAAGSGGTGMAPVSSGSQQVRWGYLLQLQQSSPRWAAAVAAYGATQPNWEDIEVGAQRSSAAEAEQRTQQYAQAIGFCRALAAAAPLLVVCNNPSCENCAGVSEAAAASKACAGCRCRYCSVACQRADWKRHKHACRCMVAAGETCV
ncbi:hypothetical protein COO60DRAFT_335067 [Scenedesmus sp. NREL 46B-D3]|nr:hypothetical protein COO60DRAFT_335067 [Scenedesmus sp. NREL 46B-D3]